ncbi:restriction endonuclease subunit S [uncultured Treponema sp.]|uniref:restriction endonuclease subunit S n=1 Tax=uncultured Treponema sp. TaxID=162155 RepID=UPI00280A50E3|nr:restriction endonuclease subunit S [uncultured Treponema sp.]
MKQTEIGLIPDDWEVKKLGDIYIFQYGDGNTNPSNNGAYPVYGANGIIGGYTKFNAVDSIVIGHMGEYAGSVIWASGKHFVTYNGTITKPKDEKNLNPKYGYYSLLFKNINKICAGSGYPFLAYDKLNLISIPLPPLAEQQRIAKALSDVDALISTTEKLIQKKKNIKQGTMQNLLTGKKRLPGFGPQTKSLTYKQTELGLIPEDWEVKTLGEICVINPASSNIIPDEFFYVDLESVSSGKLEKKQKIRRRNAPSRAQRQFEKNDILYQTVRPYQRNNLFVNFDSKNYIASTGYAIIRSNNNIDAHYIYQIIHMDNFVNIVLDNCTGTSYPAINPKFLKTIPVIIPSKEEQTAIANVLSSMDKEIETLNTKLEKYRNLKTAMMQQLLTGKIRLVK